MKRILSVLSFIFLLVLTVNGAGPNYTGTFTGNGMGLTNIPPGGAGAQPTNGVLTSLALGIFTNAGTYYVNPETGNDANAGITSFAPKQSLYWITNLTTPAIIYLSASTNYFLTNDSNFRIPANVAIRGAAMGNTVINVGMQQGIWLRDNCSMSDLSVIQIPGWTVNEILGLWQNVATTATNVVLNNVYAYNNDATLWSAGGTLTTVSMTNNNCYFMSDFDPCNIHCGSSVNTNHVYVFNNCVSVSQPPASGSDFSVNSKRAFTCLYSTVIWNGGGWIVHGSTGANTGGIPGQMSQVTLALNFIDSSTTNGGTALDLSATFASAVVNIRGMCVNPTAATISSSIVNWMSDGRYGLKINGSLTNLTTTGFTITGTTSSPPALVSSFLGGIWITNEGTAYRVPVY